MRTSSESRGAALISLLDTAVSRGVIDRGQRDALQALASELAGTTYAATAPNSAPAQTGAEARAGFNAVTVAYALGALLVLFALGWFLFDRWKALGAGGVLIVSALYTAAFAGASVMLRQRGFRVAGGFAALAAVAMTPVWSWAIMRLAGEWPDALGTGSDALARYEPYVASRWIVLELATIGVALAAARRVRFSVLGAPIALAFVLVLLHLGWALGDPRLAWYTGPYYQAVVACTVLAVAYAVDRRQPEGGDYAVWFYIGGLVMLFTAYVQLWRWLGAWRHALVLVALALVVAALYLRRRTLLVGGGVAAFAYLAYLAFDVFRRVVALPVALAGLGLLVIVATVWMQRRFPALVRRVNAAESGERKALPTGPIAVLGPLAIALTALGFAMAEAKDRTAELDWRNSIYRLRARHNEATRIPPPPLPASKTPPPLTRP